MAYCIAMVLIFLKVFLMVAMGILRFFASFFIDGMHRHGTFLFSSQDSSFHG